MIPNFEEDTITPSVEDNTNTNTNTNNVVEDSSSFASIDSEIIPEVERRNLAMMEALEAQEDYKGILKSTTDKDGEKILYFLRSAYKDGYENSTPDDPKLFEEISTHWNAKNSIQKLLASDETLHIFSRYGLTTIRTAPNRSEHHYNMNIAEAFNQKKAAIKLYTAKYAIGEFALPLLFRDPNNPDNLSNISKMKKEEKKIMYYQFHIPTGLWGEQVRSFLPILHKKMMEVPGIEAKRSAEASVRRAQEEEAHRRELERNPQAPDDIIHLMKGGSLPR